MRSKPVLGLLLGGFLGIFDGLTALFTPAARPVIVSIVIGSTFKGVVTGDQVMELLGQLTLYRGRGGPAPQDGEDGLLTKVLDGEGGPGVPGDECDPGGDVAGGVLQRDGSGH